MYDKTTIGYVQIDKIYGLINNEKDNNIKTISLDAHYEDPFIGNNNESFINKIHSHSRLFIFIKLDNLNFKINHS